MEVYGYFLSALIGLSLGLLGAGGSILTLPLLVYFFRVDTSHAVRYSLFVVGISSIAALIPKIKKGEILFRQGFLFATVSMLFVYLARTFIIPSIPIILVESEKIHLTYSALSMIIFSVLMIFAARVMLKKGRREFMEINKSHHRFLIFFSAAMTGLLTGLLGAGGGFIIVPMLMSFFGMNVQKAIGTSLLIISINSIVGFLLALAQQDTDWSLILNISVISLTGSYIGHRISLHLNTLKLKFYFGWFITILAVCIMTVQLVGVYYLSTDKARSYKYDH